MNNLKIAKMFREIALILESENVKWKPRAYNRAAITLESLDEDVSDIYKREGEKGLTRLPGIGKDLAAKIIEFMKTGKIKHYEKLKKEYPIDFDSLTSISSVGPKKAIKLYKRLGIKTLDELKEAAEKGKIRKLEGFGEQSEREILKGIELLNKTRGRLLLGDVFPTVDKILSQLRSNKDIVKVNVVGSFRRMKETVGDIDILVVSKKPKRIMDFFVRMPEVKGVQVKGLKKTTVYLKIGIDCDLRVFDIKDYGSGMLYFTGSKQHNIKLRKIAISKGYKLNEYGLIDRRTDKVVASRTEEGIYRSLGMDYIPPEMRENEGEIDLALKHRIPKLIGYDDIRGDLHVHSNWSDGSDSIEEIAVKAKGMGYEYIAITDHSVKGLPVSGGLKPSDFKKQKREIDLVNSKVKGIKVLQGVEANIMPDGSIDVSDRILSELDIVSAGVHSRFKMSKKDMTKRMIKAIENEYVNIIVHPFGRVIGIREGYDFDFDRVLDVAKDNNVILEINAFPNRLDLSPYYVRKAIDKKQKLVIGTDSHSTEQLWHMKIGIGTARRGWARKSDIINTMGLKKLKQMIKLNTKNIC